MRAKRKQFNESRTIIINNKHPSVLGKYDSIVKITNFPTHYFGTQNMRMFLEQQPMFQILFIAVAFNTSSFFSLQSSQINGTRMCRKLRSMKCCTPLRRNMCFIIFNGFSFIRPLYSQHYFFSCRLIFVVVQLH